MDSIYQDSDYTDNSLNEVSAIAQNYLSQEILPGTQNALNQFLLSPNFDDNIQLAFGENTDIQAAYTIVNDVITGNIAPTIQIVPQAQLNGNNGAFAAETNKIYLAEEI